MNDTIAAISTALGVGAISIIRISGDEAVNIVNKITKSKKIDKSSTHTIHYDFIVDNDKIIDEVLISVMLAPKTFTKEDIVEINCHGGIATTNKVLELLLTNGCRLAEPGEFTKRAFLNGRIDLIEAEGIMDLINSKTETSRNLAINQVSGRTSNLIKDLRQQIIEILANIEVNIDYPEYEDIEEMTNQMLSERISSIENKIKDILNKSENGKIVKEGINVALIGRPNVGKSSLLNCLLEQDKAIVTDIAGTTRDIVEGEIELKGIALKFIDTAGIRKTDDVVEKIGVDKSMEMIDAADLVILVLNNNEELTDEDKEIITKIKDKTHIIFINKNDLETKLEINDIDVVKGNTIDIDGLDSLKNKIVELFDLEKINNSNLEMVSSAREIGLIKEALNSIENALNNVNSQLPVDMIAIDIKKAWDLLGEITGESYQDELLDTLFSKFCLGK